VIRNIRIKRRLRCIKEGEGGERSLKWRIEEDENRIKWRKGWSKRRMKLMRMTKN
jgi:hypothetical protein